MVTGKVNNIIFNSYVKLYSPQQRWGNLFKTGHSSEFLCPGNQLY